MELTLVEVTSAIEPTYTVSFGLGEDEVRTSLIQSIEFLRNTKYNNATTLSATAYTWLYNAVEHLEKELDALLRGTLDKLEARRRQEAEYRNR